MTWSGCRTRRHTRRQPRYGSASMHTARHAALYGLGRLEEADEEYRTIEGLCPAVLDRAEATAVQVLSLTQRTRFADAIGLGIGSLRELGIVVPPPDQLTADLDRQFGYLHRWLDHTDAADDLARPDLTDPALLAASGLIDAVLPAAYFAADRATNSWLSLEALRIWLEHGRGPTLVGPAGNAAVAVVVLRGDYAAGYRAARRILALSEARGWEPGTRSTTSASTGPTIFSSTRTSRSSAPTSPNLTATARLARIAPQADDPAHAAAGCWPSPRCATRPA